MHPPKESSTGLAGVSREDTSAEPTPDGTPEAPSLERRKFLGAAGALAAAAWAGAATTALPLVGGSTTELQASAVGPETPGHRAAHCLEVRMAAARTGRNLPLPPHPDNGDENLFGNKIASYSKGLPHNALGEVNLTAYSSLLFALSSGRPHDFEDVPLGCTDPRRQRRLVNPQAGLAFDLEGTDSHQLAIPPAPTFAGAHQAAEMVELYWMALARDIPFTDYQTSPLTHLAASALSRLADFRGPRSGQIVTPGTLFRGFTPGDLQGPYLSQFLLKTVPFGAQEFTQHIQTLLPATDRLTRYNDWLDAQQGCLPLDSDQFDPVRRYIRNGRDLAQYVHVDVLFQAYFNACLILAGLGAPLNAGNPYSRSQTQDGFGTFGPPHIKALVCEVATRALKGIWFQKWYVHRRLRPEACGGRVHNRLTGAAAYPIHPDLLNSASLQQVFSQHGTYLLPQAYAEGSPLHPSYGAGHATVAGACVTILKAFFDENFEITDPVVPSSDGLSLVPYTGGGRLTAGGELNKLAANISTGRNFGGIHYRTDYSESLRLGEAIALSVLREQRLTFNEDFDGFTFTTFDGRQITV